MSEIKDQVHTEGRAAQDAQFLADVKRHLDHGCDALDARTLSRLNSIRHAALEHKQKRFSPLWLPFGGMVTATFLVFSLNLTSLQFQGAAINPADTAPIEDIEILTTTESLDFYEEYEFYQWLAENDSSV